MNVCLLELDGQKIKIWKQSSSTSLFSIILLVFDMKSSYNVEMVESFTVVDFCSLLLRCEIAISTKYFSLMYLSCPCIIDELQVIWEEVQDIKKWTDSKRQSEAEVGILADNIEMKWQNILTANAPSFLHINHHVFVRQLLNIYRSKYKFGCQHWIYWKYIVKEEKYLGWFSFSVAEDKWGNWQLQEPDFWSSRNRQILHFLGNLQEGCRGSVFVSNLILSFTYFVCFKIRGYMIDGLSRNI